MRTFINTVLLVLVLTFVAPVAFAGGGQATQSEVNAQVWANTQKIDKILTYVTDLRRENSALKRKIAKLENTQDETLERLLGFEDYFTQVKANLEIQVEGLFTLVNSNWTQFQWIESLVFGLLPKVAALEKETAPIIVSWNEELELFTQHLHVYDKGTLNLGDDKISIEPATFGTWSHTSFTMSTAYMLVTDELNVDGDLNVKGNTTFGTPCQPAYDTCDDNDPCTEDWCSPKTFLCEHQLTQECSGQ